MKGKSLIIIFPRTYTQANIKKEYKLKLKK